MVKVHVLAWKATDQGMIPDVVVPKVEHWRKTFL
jgi:hypothetical protein